MKIGHFLPWDIDGDIYVSTEHMGLFRPGGDAHGDLEEAGVSVYRHKADNYADVGAGYFRLWHGGVEVEMMGRRGGLSAGIRCAPELRGIPTSVLVSERWVRTHASPGLYARSRYRQFANNSHKQL